MQKLHIEFIHQPSTRFVLRDIHLILIFWSSSASRYNHSLLSALNRVFVAFYSRVSLASEYGWNATPAGGLWRLTGATTGHYRSNLRRWPVCSGGLMVHKERLRKYTRWRSAPHRRLRISLRCHLSCCLRLQVICGTIINSPRILFNQFHSVDEKRLETLRPRN